MIAPVRDELLGRLAEELRGAEASQKPVGPLRDQAADLTVAEAYQIQLLNIRLRTSHGRLIRGRKVGLTSRAMQHMMNVHEPDFGVLLDEMFVEDGDEIRIASLIQPKVEAEIALVLGADLIGPGVTSVVALRSIDCAVACLEIIDSRITDWKIGLVDTIADNASSALAVVSAKKCSIQNLDLRLVGMALSVNGELVDTGAGAAALGNPIRCVAWLANKLAEFGEYLHAGDVVLAGALHRAVSIKKGDSVIAEFDRLGAVHARFG